MYLNKKEDLQTIVLIFAAISFVLAELVIYFVAGQTTLIISNLFYIPIIILAFRYPKKGVIVGVLLGFCYLIAVSYLSYPLVTELIPSVMQFYVFVIISIIISSVSGSNRLSEAKYESIFNYSGSPICLVDKKSHEIIEMNPEFRTFLKVEDTPGRVHSLDEYIPDASWRERLFKTLMQNNIENWEGVVKKADGSPVSVLVNAKTFHYEEQALINFTDITKPDTALRSSEKKYQTLVETAQEGIWVTGPDGLTTYVNPKMKEMLGFSDQEMMGRPYFDFMDPAGREVARDILVSDQSAGLIKSHEFKFTRKDGSCIQTRFTTSRLMDADERVSGNIALVSDITEMVKHEKELQASVEEKSVLIMEIHHRVKNNLQIISGLIRLQSRFIQNEQAMYALRQCEARVSTMALVHESLYRSGSPANINARTHITKLGNMLLLSHETGQKIRMNFDIDDIPLDMNMAVPASLIINELLLNSIKYAFAGKDHGTIGIHLHQDPESQLTLVIEDDGIGLPDEFDINKVSSLGLKLVTRLARDQLKGTLEISQDGGTRFSIRFPYSVVETTLPGEIKDAR